MWLSSSWNDQLKLIITFKRQRFVICIIVIFRIDRITTRIDLSKTSQRSQTKILYVKNKKKIGA